MRQTWTASDLIERLCHALEIARTSVALLAADGYLSEDDGTPSLRGEKVVTETGMLLLAAKSVARHGDAVQGLVRELAASLVPHARGERVRARMCMEPSLALDHAAAHLCLSRLGLPDPDLDRLLSQCLRASSARSRERHPHRELEQEWLMRVWNVLPAPAPEDRYLPRHSALGRPMELLSVSRDEIYAFTHALLYLTDLGTRTVRLPRSPRAIAADADAALASSLAASDFDVAGEVLLTWPFLRRRWSRSATVGFAILASVEDRAGFLPGLGISLERLDALEGKARTRYAVATAYHTAFVMGLLSAAALSASCAPPLRPARVAPSVRGASNALLALLDDDDPGQPWRTYVNELPAAVRDGAAELILNICLQRSTIRRDLGSLVAALRLAEHHGLLGIPACHQAAQLLRRSVSFAAMPTGMPPTPVTVPARGRGPASPVRVG